MPGSARTLRWPGQAPTLRVATRAEAEATRGMRELAKASTVTKSESDSKEGAKRKVAVARMACEFVCEVRIRGRFD